ncbi:MAG: Smr/MutS family protein [Candidatus Eremiobacteraeota bacterium]|nr:Smr/MutS family protein [Candidatus Eremiobacteraeota bacterium]
MIGFPAGHYSRALLQALEFPVVLEKIAPYATCEPGATAVRALLPVLAVEDAEAELRLVDDASAYLQVGGEAAFGGVEHVGAAIDWAEKGASLSGTDLARIAHAEKSLSDAGSSIDRADEEARRFTRLTLTARTRADTRELVRALASAIDEEGAVLDAASAALAKLRRQRRTLHDEVREHLTRIVRNPATAKLLSEPIVTVRGGRYVVPVRAEVAGELAGVVHDQSASGNTVYVEPLAAVAANNRLRGIDVAEEREVARILSDLSAHVARYADALRANGALIIRLDSVFARARWALENHALRPQLSDERAVRINRGCHPLLAHKPVPLDAAVGESSDALILSGPNMGGKTVVLKTIGLFCLLAYAGVPLPAAPGTRIGRFDHIACIIGDEQSIADDISSFSAHLRALRAAYDRAGPRSLVLVDELGSGTEPGAGAALAQAFVEGVLARGGAAVVTTHYTQLKVFAASVERVTNASMLFDSESNQPSYVLAMGVPGQSLAFSLARSLRLDQSLISRAESLLGSEADKLERAFAQLSAESERWRLERPQLEREREGTRGLEAQLKRKLVAFERQRSDWDAASATALEKAVRSVREDVLAQAQRSAADSRRRGTAAAMRVEPQQLEAARAEMRRTLGLVEPTTPAPAPAAVRPGDRVTVRTLGRVGVVSEVYERDVLVSVGNMKTVVSPSDLELESGSGRDEAAGQIKRSSPGAVHAIASAKAQEAATTIDVRGMRVDEAVPLVDKALDDASLSGLASLRIVHGKGTGQLSKGIRDFLSGHVQVGHAAFAGDPDGGSGVTVVTLR